MIRCAYRATNGDLFVVMDNTVQYVDAQWNTTLLGTIDPGTSICSMADNSLCAVLVDGSSKGYAINLTGHAFGQINADPAFYGADRADFLDTFFTFNRPGTNQFYISLSNVTYATLTSTYGAILTLTLDQGGSGYTNGTYTGVALTGGTGTGATVNLVISGGSVTSATLNAAGSGYTLNDPLSASAGIGAGTGLEMTAALVAVAFDPLDIAAKTGFPDPIVSQIVMHREIWLIGSLTTEIWYDSGAADFTMERMPGVFVEQGCIAKYSVAKQDLSVYWLSQDYQGRAIVMRGSNYAAQRISTHAIENEFMGYSTLTDAIGFTYQEEGHTFYVLNFPTADKTWVWDEAAQLWHERAWCDANGTLHRHRAQVATYAYNTNVAGDHTNNNLYAYDNTAYDDAGSPIVRIKSFPHMVDDGNRVIYNRFIADMEVGTDTDSDTPEVSLRWSDTRGASYGTAIEQSMGKTGEYLTSIQWRRLGMARDRVFELSWSAPVKTALNGAFVEFTPAQT